jgi:hypothetical protein
MKTIKKMFICLESYIKKNFFNLSKTDISQDCEKMFGMDILSENEVEEKTIPVEEYVSDYKSTTRWQTL